jgi:uncharacterized protein YecE (DUF72 family)
VRHAIRIGTAGWTIPRAVSKRFPGEGGQLARYARLFNAAEINTSFYRSHRPATYARWAECVPTDFRFSVKVPRTITHERRLVEMNDLFENFLAEAAELGEKLGPLLIQLPPSLAFDPAVAETFFSVVRERFAGLIAFEPRHASWFEPQTEALLRAHEIARVAADPVWAEGGASPAAGRASSICDCTARRGSISRLMTRATSRISPGSSSATPGAARRCGASSTIQRTARQHRMRLPFWR